MKIIFNKLLFFLSVILVNTHIFSQTKVDLFTGWSGSSTADHVVWQPAFEDGTGWYGAVYTQQQMTNTGAISGQNVLSNLRWNIQYDNQGSGTTRTFDNVNIYLYESTTAYFPNPNKPTLPVGAVKVFSGTLKFKIPSQGGDNREKRNHLCLKTGRNLVAPIGVLRLYKNEKGIQTVINIINA